jgi:hypothetical protein
MWKNALASTVFACAACGDSGGDGAAAEASACDRDAQCTVIDGTPTCDEGFKLNGAEGQDSECVALGGRWQSEVDVNSLDDTKTILLSVEANESFQGFVEEITPVMALRCKSHEVEVLILTGSTQPETGNFDHATATIRLDAAPAFTVNCSESTTGNALFVPNPAELVAELLNTDTMLFQFTPFQVSPTIAAFDTRFLSEVVEPLQDECGI